MSDQSVRTGDIVGGVVSTGNVGGGIFISSVNNMTKSEPRQTLAEAAEEIERLLKQLEETNPNATEIQQITYIDISTKPLLKQRAIAALKEGGETAIEEFFLENKYLKIGKAVIKGWLQPSS